MNVGLIIYIGFNMLLFQLGLMDYGGISCHQVLYIWLNYLPTPCILLCYYFFFLSYLDINGVRNILRKCENGINYI